MRWDFLTDPTVSGQLCLTLLHSVWLVTLLAAFAWIVDRLVGRRAVERSYAIHVVALLASMMALPATYWVVAAQGVAPPVEVAAVAEAAPTATPAPLAAESPDEISPETTAPVAGHAVETPPAANVPVPPQPVELAAAPSPPGPDLWPTIAPWLAGLYMAGVAAMLLRLALGMWRAQKLGARAKVLRDGPLVDMLRSLAGQWSMHVAPTLARAERIVTPKVIGLLRPTILLPASAISGLSTDELELILAHELAHVRRHDMWINLLQRLAETVLFFNPALWYLSRRVSLLREYCCDEVACSGGAESGCEPHVRYAQALLRVVELAGVGRDQSELASLAASGRSPSELRRRVARLFGEPIAESVRLSRSGMLLTAALALLLVAGPVVWQSAAETPTDIASMDREDADTSDAESVPKDALPEEDTKYEQALQRYRTAKKEQERILAEKRRSDPAFNRATDWLENERPGTNSPYRRLEREFLAANPDKKTDFRRWSRGFTAAIGRETIAKEWTEQPTSHAALLFNADLMLNYARKGVEQRGGDGMAEIPELTGTDAERWKQAQAHLSNRSGTMVIDYDYEALEQPLEVPEELKDCLRADTEVGSLSTVYSLYNMAHMPPEVKTLRKQITAAVNELNALRPGWQVEEGIEAPRREDAKSATQTPGASPHTDADTPADSDDAPAAEMSIVVARHALLLEGKDIITWPELDDRLAALPNPPLAKPSFYITRGTREAGNDKLAKEQIWRLRTKHKLAGHTLGFLWPQADRRYDAVKEPADLVPDENLKIDGKVVDAEGDAVAGAEVILIPPANESDPHDTYYVSLRDGRIRNRLQHEMAVTDEAGQFTLYPVERGDYRVVALHRDAGIAGGDYRVVALHRDAGIADVLRSDLADPHVVTLSPWATLVIEVGEEDVEQDVSVSTRLWDRDGWPGIKVTQEPADSTNGKPSEREFRFTHVPCNFDTSIQRLFPVGQGTWVVISGTSVSLLPQEDRRLNLGALSQQQREQLKRRREDVEERNRELEKRLEAAKEADETANDADEARMVLAKFIEGRNKFRSGVFSIEGQYDASDPSSRYIGPVEMFSAFDYARDRLRFDRRWSFQSAEPGAANPTPTGKVTIRGGRFVRLPDRLIRYWEDRNGTVEISRPGSETPADVFPFDVRAVGVCSWLTLAKTESHEDILRGFDEYLVGYEHSEDGIHRLTWENDEYKTRWSVHFDSSKGFVPVRYELSARKKASQEPEDYPPVTVVETTWQESEGIWVPASCSFDIFSPSPRRQTLLFAWKSVNQPVDDSLFTVEGMNLPEGTHVSDARPGLFQLRVHDQDQNAVPEALVEIRTDPKPKAEHILDGTFVRTASYGTFAKTDKDGLLRFEFAEETKRLNLSIKTPGYGPYWAGWHADGHGQTIPAHFSAHLEPAWSVGGIIVDEAGKPIEGVEVHPNVNYKKRPGDDRQLGMGERFKTDAQGIWSFDCVPVSMDKVFVEIDHPDYMPVRRRLPRADFETNPGAAAAGRIVLSRGLTVSGKVTDDAGNPIEGALLRTKFVNDIREAKTDETGRYTLVGCEPRMAKIVVSAKGRATDMQEVQIKPEMKPVDFQMQPGGKVRIRVLDEDDNPIPRARVLFQRWRGWWERFEFGDGLHYTDENGVWEWNEAPLDEFQADICRPGGMYLPRQKLLVRDEEYVFHPPPALVITGKVVDASTQELIKEFQAIPARMGNPSSIIWQRDEGDLSTDGTYRLRRTSGCYAYLVRIEANGYQAAISREIKDNEGNVTLDFELKKGKDVAATVLTPDGKPAAGAEVALGVGGSQIMVKNGEFTSQTYASRTTADESGKFHFPAQGSDFELVVIHTTGFARAGTPAASPPETIELTPWARVEGTFRIGQNPASDTRLRLSLSGHNSYGNDLPSISFSHETTTGNDGAYLFDRVIPGEGRIGCDMQLMADSGSQKKLSSSMLPIEVPPGGTVRFDFGGTGRAVIGKLVPPEGYTERVLWNFALVTLDLPNPETPTSLAEAPSDPEATKAWWAEWMKTEEGKAWNEANERYNQLRQTKPYITATVGSDGIFRIDDVPPDEYTLRVGFDRESPGHLPDYRFEVPETDAVSSDPIDLGTLKLAAE